MKRGYLHRTCRRLLHHGAGVHHHHPIAEGEGDTQVVGDEDEGHSALALDRTQELEHLLLGRGVEGRRGLIGEQDHRVDGKGGSDGHALAHASGELEGIALGDGWIRDADFRQASDDLIGDLFAGPSGRAECLGDVLSGGHGRVEHGEGVLHEQADA